MTPLWTLSFAAAAIAVAVVLWRQYQANETTSLLRSQWGRFRDRERKFSDIAAYHHAVSRGDSAALDDRTWADLTLDDVFEDVDRTESGVGQQVLYHRLRGASTGNDLATFEAMVTTFTDAVPVRERAQRPLLRLKHAKASDLWQLTQPNVLSPEPWHVLFPFATVGMVILVALSFRWPGARLLLALGVIGGIVIRGTIAHRLQLAVGSFRQLGPLVAAADALSRLSIPGAESATTGLANDVRTLARIRRIATWVGRETAASGDIVSLVLEYLNLVLLIDANALFMGARELNARRADIQRAVLAVGDVDAALAVASYRAGTAAAWTRPTFLPPNAPVVLADLCHPLVDAPVPNSITLAPPFGVIVTGSNMSGKSTFLRAVGVNVVLAQTINMCLASKYEAPRFIVRSCIGRSDDITTGKSYYIVEVESVLALVKASESAAPHLFLFDELFRGTNAVERIAAGEAVLAELLTTADGRPPVHLVLAATHDRELVDLLRESYAAFHLADSVGSDGLVFTYKLEPGPATTRNAIALLQLKGAPARLVERALRRAES